MHPLAQAAEDLSTVVESLNATISPLQGTAERLGRFVDRLPASRRRPAVT